MDEIEKEKLKYTLNINPGFDIASNNTCKLFRGPIKKDGYQYLNYKLKGDNKQSTASRLAFFIFGPEDLPPINECCDLHVSHLCHNKRCINIDHLILEAGAINCGRRLCHREKRCHENHDNGPKCLVHLILD